MFGIPLYFVLAIATAMAYYFAYGLMVKDDVDGEEVAGILFLGIPLLGLAFPATIPLGIGLLIRHFRNNK